MVIPEGVAALFALHDETERRAQAWVREYRAAHPGAQPAAAMRAAGFPVGNGAKLGWDDVVTAWGRRWLAGSRA